MEWEEAGRIMKTGQVSDFWFLGKASLTIICIHELTPGRGGGSQMKLFDERHQKRCQGS